MKKIYSLLLASALVFTSCSDFLDTKPQGKLTQDIFFGEEEGALMGINAIYSQMKSWDLIGFSWFGIMEVPSDNSDTGSSPADGSYARVNSLNDFTYDVYTSELNGWWTGNYKGIGFCNVALDNLDVLKDEQLKIRSIAQARFFRGFFYFNLVRTYGCVPLVTKVQNPDEYDQPCASEEAIYQQIIDDLSYAAKNWSEEETLKSLTYIGNYLLVKKDSEDSWGNRNVLYLVYKAQVNDVYTNGEETYDQTNDIYWYTAYYDLLVNPEGVTTVDLTDYSTPGDSFTIDSGISSGWWSTKSWYYYGYETLEKLYKAAVIANSESYKHEDNVGEDMGAAVELEEEKADEKENGIIFPNSSREEITEKDAADLSDEELRYAINELYARHGYIFKDDAMRSYYENFDWYEETVAPDAFSLDLFNDTERKNIEILQKERDRRN